MRSRRPGTTAPEVEVTNVSANGVWLWVSGAEHFMAYDDFPWFRDVPVRKIINVQQLVPGHFYWPDLDVDLTVEMIEHPTRFPLKMQ